jgi:glucose-1-phosphate cytidylyltransferase
MATFDNTSVMILCGGLGTRLREETEFKPKPMVEIGTRPILWHIMKIYSLFGLRKFVLCLGHRGDVIRKYFTDYSVNHSNFKVNLRSNTISVLDQGEVEDWEITMVETGALTMTGGRVLTALPYVAGDQFFLTYGDGVADIRMDDLLRFHHSRGLGATITGVHPSSRFGEINEQDGRVVGFREKPQTKEDWINGGFFVFKKEVFRKFEFYPECVLERDILPELAANGDLAVYKHHGFWQCMDTYREMQFLNSLCDDGPPPWLTQNQTAGTDS